MLPEGMSKDVALELANQRVFLRRPVRRIQVDGQGMTVESVAEEPVCATQEVASPVDLFERFVGLVQTPPEGAEELPLTMRCRIGSDVRDTLGMREVLDFDLYHNSLNSQPSIDMSFMWNLKMGSE